MSPAVQRVVFCVLAAVVFLEVGCVSRRTYERVKAETVEQSQALEAVRGDVRELDQEIAGLQASNRREDAAMSELRGTIQREEEQLPIMRQRAEDALASLKTQVATLMNQSWQLARKIVDIRQESVSLRTKVAQYKQDMEAAQAPAMVASGADTPSISQPTIIAEAPEPSAPPLQETTPPQMTESTPATPSVPSAAPSVPSPSVTADPSATSDSWIGMIVGWLTTFWNWLFS
jgi:hypothetical protein